LYLLHSQHSKQVQQSKYQKEVNDYNAAVAENEAQEVQNQDC